MTGPQTYASNFPNV